MASITLTRRTALSAALGVSLAALALGASAQESAPQIDKIHFIVPGGAGGGWDGTARGTGEALTNAGLVGTATYENMSGGGSGVAMNYLIENAESNYGTLLVNSTPLIIRGLNGEIDTTFRDLTPVAGTIGDYAAFVVRADSELDDMTELLEAFEANPASVSFGGGSVPGGMDHLVAAIAMQAAGIDPLTVNYIPYDAGGEAMAALLSGEIQALSTGFSEAVPLAEAGEIKILAVTAPERVPAAPDVPTLREQGIDSTFINWRGFFAAPGLPEEQLTAYQDVLEAMYDTPEWEEVRARNGWVNIFNRGDEFTAFLEAQEKEMGDLMKRMGFL
ncbi:tripartite tricarboxylate transporter substrate binding protein [Salinarimonas rosea]|uniref:tripartite tricarboxylate transporter substrate binding protein n=1 Tax=Salinarimonas rosea TaxID=552063 RepID=UPI00041A72AE|nr:tripartite tricarboxylate transporter substrate-binding protein [Salinarimonas rosea]